VKWRAWLRSLVDESWRRSELHVLDVPDAGCKERLWQRNASGEHPFQVDEATYDQFMSYFVSPRPEEGFKAEPSSASTRDTVIAASATDRLNARMFTDGRGSMPDDHNLLSLDINRNHGTPRRVHFFQFERV
jgi:hypothetical protein